MKINLLETHDRLIHFKKEQALNLNQGADDCLKKNRLSLGLQQYSPYIYIFAHPRTLGYDERMKLFITGNYPSFDKVPTNKMLWQGRLTKPKAQTNSYLFRAISNTDKMEICWLIPPREQWNQYKKGNVTEHEFVLWSIDQFLNHRAKLEEAFPDDLSDQICKDIYTMVAADIDHEKRMKKMYSVTENSNEFVKIQEA